MDANETRFHLLLGNPDWGRCVLPDGQSVFTAPNSPIQWDTSTREIRLRSEIFRFKAAPRDDAPTLDDRRGAAADRYSNWYWISEDETEIRAFSSGASTASHFWSASDVAPATSATPRTFAPINPPSPPAPRRLSGAAVTCDHFLVVGTIDPGGLLVFDLLGGGSPRELRWPVPFAAFDMSARPGGGVAILDRIHRRFWVLDRALHVISSEQTEDVLCSTEKELFQPDDGSTRRFPVRTFPEGLPTQGGSPVEDENPISIEALSDGTILILNTPLGGNSRVSRYRMSTRLETIDLPFAAHDFAVCADRLYIVSSEGNQAYAYTLTYSSEQFSLELVEGYFPMRRFNGKALVTAPGRTGPSAYYDFGEHWYPLVSQSYPRHVSEGVFETQSPRNGVDHPGFDGKQPQCVWHRLIFDGCLPPGTTVDIWSRAADSEDELVFTNWMLEPAPYRRATGSELPFTRTPSGRRGSYELLFQKAKGRYLQLKIRLAGDGRVTPRIHALRLYYPRFSYLERYLPAVYRENPESASFLDRFLANIEGTNTAIEDKIAAAQLLFDVKSAPTETLDWLATWFGAVLDPAWDERRRRLFLKNAMTFFQWRGTVRGLKMALRLAFEAQPDSHIFDPPGEECLCADRYRIVEKFRTRQISPVQLGDPTDRVNVPTLVSADAWTLRAGASALLALYQTATGQTTFSLAPLADATQENLRNLFAQQTLGFVPSDPTDEVNAWTRFLQGHAWTGATTLPDQTPTDPTLASLWRSYQVDTEGEPYGRQRRLWQQFLSRRYISVSALNRAHAVVWESFDTVAYPSELPTQGEQLSDWFEFEAHVLPTLANAHRFTVLLPVSTLTSLDDATRQQELALANRLIELEKPAHTTFDVKFFWALFRVGEARLGSDSVLGLGARDPAYLNLRATVGRTYLGEAPLAIGFPPSMPGRIVSGRDRLRILKPKNQKTP